MAIPVEKPVRPSEALSRNQLLEYYFARLARDVEERLVIRFRQSKGIGGLYRSLGREGEMRRASVDAPVPYAPPLDAAFLPSVEKVVADATRLVEY